MGMGESGNRGGVFVVGDTALNMQADDGQGLNYSLGDVKQTLISIESEYYFEIGTKFVYYRFSISLYSEKAIGKEKEIVETESEFYVKQVRYRHLCMP